MTWKSRTTGWLLCTHTINPLTKTRWMPKQVWQDKVNRGEDKSPINSDEFQGGLALYLTPIKVIKSWPLYSREYIEHFKKRLNAYAQGVDVNAVL
jgi:hypothetical protein